MKTTQIDHLGEMARLYDVPEMTFDVLMQAANLRLRESALDSALAIIDAFFAEWREATFGRARHSL